MNNGEASENSSVSGKKSFSRHFLVLTISNRPDQYQLGPSDRNWQQTPFICEGEICPGYSHCNGMDMRRWRSLLTGTALHQFADLTFLDVCCSVEEATAAFLRNNSNQGIPDDIPTNCNFEKGLYEEIHSVGWEGPHPASAESNCDQWQSETEEEDDEESSCWGDYPMEEDEERDKNTGYLLIGHPSAGQLANLSFSRFASDWHNWCAIRDLSESLPPKCIFRRLSFYRECTGRSRYGFVLLVEVDNAMQHLRPISNCVNNAQSLCANRAYIGLYQEIEFEMDLEILQNLVAAGQSINCVGRRLVVEFGSKQQSSIRKPTRFSLYQGISSIRASSPTSPSASLSTALNLLNNNFSNNLPKSGTGEEFDAEMEEIELEGEEDENGNNDNSIKGNGGRTRTKGDCNADDEEGGRRRKSSWNFVKNLFTTTTQQMPELVDGTARKISNNNNNNNIANGNDDDGTIKIEERGRAKGSDSNKQQQFTRIRSAFSVKQSIGSFWRKMSTKY